MISSSELKFSPDYPGYLEDRVAQELQTGCVFMQGAAGDMSTNPPAGFKGPQAYGERLAEHVIELGKTNEQLRFLRFLVCKAA